MRITVLGSAAAEGIPALFCTCEVCRAARTRGGRELRRRTAYLGDDDLLVDFGPDLYWASVDLDLDLSRLRHLLVTHSHPDHFQPEELGFRAEGFSYVPPENRLTMHGNRQVGEALERTLGDLERCRLSFRRARSGEPVDLGGGRSAVPLPAAHGQDEECFLWLLQDGERTALIGNDTGWWPAQTWELLAGQCLDLLIADCTYGERDERRGHLGAPAVLALRTELLRLGIITPATLVVANHFSHNGRLGHAELERLLEPEGIVVGYDGLVLEV